MTALFSHSLSPLWLFIFSVLRRHSEMTWFSGEEIIFHSESRLWHWGLEGIPTAKSFQQLLLSFGAGWQWEEMAMPAHSTLFPWQQCVIIIITIKQCFCTGNLFLSLSLLISLSFPSVGLCCWLGDRMGVEFWHWDWSLFYKALWWVYYGDDIYIASSWCVCLKQCNKGYNVELNLERREQRTEEHVMLHSLKVDRLYYFSLKGQMK